MKTSSSTVCCALILLLLIAPTSASPQGKQGTVNIDSLEVYSRMSTESDVVKRLAKGTVVRILLAVSGDEGNWCGVASQDSSSRIGYVLCSGLDRPKVVPGMAAQGGARLQILIGNSHTPVKATQRQTHGGEEAGLLGQTLAPPPGYSWNSYPKTLVLALRRSCPYCKASLPFYKQLGDLENSGVLHSHLLVVMRSDESAGRSFLKTGDVEVQGIFGIDFDDLKVPGTPTLLLLNSSGVIEHAWVGQLTPRMEKDVISAAEE